MPTSIPTTAPTVAAPVVASPAGVSIHQIGELVGGRYRLERMLGHGALTETWQASHVELQRAVAIKFLRQQAIGVGEKMIEVARAVARVRHPHVLEFNDFGRMSSGDPYFVTELLVGQTVEQLIARRGTVPWSRAVNIAQQVSAALGAAHQHGIVHGDLRPGNVFLVETGEVGDFVKVVDFGLARGTTIGGTPAYMSPEQCRNETLDARSDVYALGCLLFAMVTGEPPFVGDPDGMRWRQMNEAPKGLRERAPRQFIPDELEAIVARCLAKPPAQRYPDTRELGGALATLANFAAATSVAGGVIQDVASGSGSRPMTFANRPPLKDESPPEAAKKPITSSTSAVANKPAGLTAGAVVGIVFASVAVAAVAGLGVWWLVSRLIAEPGAAAQSESVESSTPAAATPSKAAEPAPEPAERATTGEQAVTAQAPTPASAPPSEAAVDATQPTAPTSGPSKSKSSQRGVDGEAEPEPAPTPAPVPEPEPAEKKPSMKPDSNANKDIGHEELVDPWQ